MRDVAKLLHLTPSEFADLLRAALLLPRVFLALRWRGVRAVRETMGGIDPVRVRCDPSLRAQQIARMVSVAARRGPLHANCLVQSLALERLLRREGIQAELRLGARRIGDRLEAHAWVEHDGRPLMEPADVTARFPPFEAVSPEYRQ